MKILVSACLLGENCKYSGGNNFSEAFRRFSEGHEVIAVCPEVLGGLPTPRPASEIRNGLVVNNQGQNVDREFRAGAEKALQIAMENRVDCAVLMSRSPSCGIGRVYDGSFSRTLIDGNGIFAQRLIQSGIKVIDAADI